MEGSPLAFSFQPPAAGDSVPSPYPSAGDSDPSPYPSAVLLDKIVYFAHHENATTKEVKTSADHEVQISFCLADLPDVSHFCVHSPQIRREDYTFEPQVVSSAENLVLICFAFRTDPESTDIDSDLVEFLVCKAGSGGDISFEPVPYSPTGSRHSSHAGIVPRGGGNFLVTYLSPRADRGHYDLHVFSSETSKWTSKYLQLPTPADALPRDLPSLPDKVISLRGSVVGFVDLWRGIVCCDVLEKEPVLTFIPLPTTAFNLRRTGQAQKVRDVAYCNGYISFVEIEHCHRKRNIDNLRSFMMTQDLDTEYDISDKACLADDDWDNTPESVPDGWKIRTMFRDISWDYWKRRYVVHVDDISDFPEHSELLPEIWNEAMEYTLRNLKTIGFPFFDVCSDNIVYFLCKVESDDEVSWIVGVDLKEKKLEIIEPYCAESDSSFDSTVLPCTFSEYMNATPRPYAELDEASFSQNGVQPVGDIFPVASSAQNGVLNGHLPLGNTVPDNVEPPNTLNVNGYDGSWNESSYGAQSDNGNYKQSPPLPPNLLPTGQPMSAPLPTNLPQTVQPMPSLTQSGYIYAHWTVPDSNGRMLISVPLNGMKKPVAAPLVLSTPPVPWPNSWLQDKRLQINNSHQPERAMGNTPCEAFSQGDELDYGEPHKTD